MVALRPAWVDRKKNGCGRVAKVARSGDRLQRGSLQQREHLATVEGKPNRAKKSFPPLGAGLGVASDIPNAAIK